MTGSSGNETCPLLNSTERTHKRFYDAVSQQNGKSSSDEACLQMESIHRTKLSPKDAITFTWHEMNVYTAENGSRKRWKIWSQDKHRIGTSQRKHIIKNVSGIARPGELVAILGSSGAGKTTLLNALMLRTQRELLVTGTCALNGIPASGNTLARLSAYVQQEDLFIGTLTVKEHLVFQALVRMDNHIPYKQRMKRVQEVISELGLTSCQNTIIGIPGRIKGVSGGEMKRLSFASEVLTNPPLMFCDEPTSGLDAFMAQNVVSVLKSMAEKGKTVVCTIHQPSSEVFALFDKLLLMAEGRVAFHGSPTEACEFFKGMGAVCPKNYNPADFFIQLLAVIPSRETSCKESINLICDTFADSSAGRKIHKETKVHVDIELERSDFHRQHSPYKASWLAQMRAVLWRSSISILKEPVLIKVRVLQSVLVSLLIGFIYFGQHLDQNGVMNINGAIFIFLTNMTFQNVFAVINVFCSELPVFLREHFNGMYRTDVYFICKTVAEIPIFIFITFIFSIFSYFMIGLNPDVDRFFFCAFTLILVANVAISFGYFISCLSKNISMALSIGPPIIIPFLLFGGFFLNNSSVPVYFKWLSYLSWFKYGNEALLANQWRGVEHIECTFSNLTCPRNGHVILETLNFSEDNMWPDTLCLSLLIFGFRVLAFLALLSKTTRLQ